MHAFGDRGETGSGLLSTTRVSVRIVPSDLYFSNKIHHLLDGEDAADVYMSGPVLMWEHLGSTDPNPTGGMNGWTQFGAAFQAEPGEARRQADWQRLQNKIKLAGNCLS